jgi:hypothetical protein
MGLIKTLSEVSDVQIDRVFLDELRDFLYRDDFSDPVLFLRNILDRMVIRDGCAGGGCSDIIVSIIVMALRDYPESSEEAQTRRSKCD